MEIALKDNKRIKASPEIKFGICPLCKKKVIAKCGEIKVWHWAHEKKEECDLWGEPESKWHQEWKAKFPKECREKIIEKKIKKAIYSPYPQGYEEKFVKHRADIKINNLVIELQYSNLSVNKIKEREEFYGSMIWLLCGTSFAKNLDLREKEDKGIFTFRWKHPPKSWWFAKKEIYIDLHPLADSLIEDRIKIIEKEGVFQENETYDKLIKLYSNSIFLIKRIYKNIPCGGWGKVISKKRFMEEFLNGK